MFALPRCLEMTIDLIPERAKCRAVVAPEGPAPMIRTGTSIFMRISAVWCRQYSHEIEMSKVNFNRWALQKHDASELVHKSSALADFGVARSRVSETLSNIRSAELGHPSACWTRSWMWWRMISPGKVPPYPGVEPRLPRLLSPHTRRDPGALEGNSLLGCCREQTVDQKSRNGAS